MFITWSELNEKIGEASMVEIEAEETIDFVDTMTELIARYGMVR